jgi:hypothetical protein
MKFWKKLNGDCGCMDDGGHVPDSVEISEQEYLDWVGAQPVLDVVDHKAEYSKLLTDQDKIDYIAKRLNLKD